MTKTRSARVKRERNGVHGLYVSEEMWQRAERRAEVDGVNVNFVMNELYEGYVIGKIKRIPHQAEGKTIARTSTHSVAVPNELWAKLKRIAAAQSIPVNTITRDLMDAYGRGKVNLPKVVKTY